MGQCVSSMPAENITNKHKDKINNETRHNRQTTNSITQTFDDDKHKPHTHDYNTILSSPGQLEIPDRFKSWFPPRHGHLNIRNLFKWHQELGNGVTGAVHEIEYKQQTCAVKMVEKNEQWGRMLFTTEARVLSKLRHCGIIGFVDMFFDDRYYYLVLEKADFDLYYVMKKKGHLTERKTRNITYAILKAISYMHKKNLVHRDLKPENVVFLSADTNQPRLIDFGDAEMAQKDKVYTEFVGTPPYMSPERLDEHRGWQLKKADIWAIAVIAYEMYCGQRCFGGETQKQVFGRILRGEWNWPNHRKSPSEDMQDFIGKCLMNDAKDRPTANEALQHRWFDVKRREEEEEERQRQLSLQSQLRLNDVPSAVLCIDDFEDDKVTYTRLSVGTTSVDGVMKIKDITETPMFENLASMVKSNPLQDILVKGYIENMGENDLEPYHVQFDKLDSNKDGFITGTDLVNAFVNNGIGPNQASSLASIVISELDADRNGKVSFRQFLSARMRYDLSDKPKQIFDEIMAVSSSQLLPQRERVKLRQDMQICVNGFDSERSPNMGDRTSSIDDSTDIVYKSEGGISREDIIMFSESQMQLKYDEKQSLEAIFEKYDGDGDGVLTFSDFVQAVYSQRVVDAPVRRNINANTDTNTETITEEIQNFQMELQRSYSSSSHKPL